MADGMTGDAPAGRAGEPTPRGRELTPRALALGIAITLVFTAANVYLGLKVGLTFATSIPAAVISMALLRFARGSSIFENNIVQTVASAAGAMASIIFILPGLVLCGWWRGFAFWPTFLLCATGGMIGVLVSVPLRRVLVTGSDLPYPEGVAAAEVLRVGSGTADGAAENRLGLIAVTVGGIAAAGFSLLCASRLALQDLQRWFRIGGTDAASGLSAGLYFAMIGAGHLVGLPVGLALLTGAVIAFGIATPLLTWLHPVAGAADIVARDVWVHQVRFIGAGMIGVAALWTLATLLKPLRSGLDQALAAARARRRAETLAIEERDIPIGLVALGTLALMAPVCWLLWRFLGDGPLAPLALPITAGAALFVLLASGLLSAVCGYMAGLIGSSNSPLSGLCILGVLAGALLLALFVPPGAGGAATPQLVAFALFATAIVTAAATIANDNLQDLKTGELIGATPWKQQVALLVGTVAGSAMIAPVLALLERAYGFSGEPGPARAAALAAPQANLLTALAKGVLGANLDWSLIGIGGLIGVGLVLLDAALRRAGKGRLPPLAVGIGIYLPMSATLAVTIGAIIGRRFEARHPDETTRRAGVLLASGFIVGESLFGVALAGLIVATGSDAPLALVGDGFAGPAMAIGPLVFAGLLAVLYRWVAVAAAKLRAA